MKRKLRIFIFILMTSSVGYFLIQRQASIFTTFISSEEIFDFPCSFLTQNTRINEVSCVFFYTQNIILKKNLPTII